MKNAFVTRLLAPLLATSALAAAGPAQAHPHVWVTVHAAVLYEQGAVSGVQHDWTFDEMFAAMAIEGLDANKDGQYDRKELAELAQVNIDGLKEFEYFTYAKLSETKLAFAAPKDYWLEYANGLLTLHFNLPLGQPVPAETPGFTFSVYDPTFFIAFDFAKDNPVTMAGAAPAGCKAALKADDAGQDQQSLAQAFGTQMGPLGTGTAGTNTVEVTCGK